MAALVLAVPIAGFAEDRANWVTLAVGTVTEAVEGLSIADGTGASLKEGYLERVAGALDVHVGTEEVADGFVDECVSLDGREDVYSEGGDLVGFTATGSDVDTFRDLKQELQGNGWQWVESGSDNQATFLKREGAYHWLFLSCLRVGERTSVVVQVA